MIPTFVILGAYNVYRNYEIVEYELIQDEPINQNYCDYNAYTFSFIVITIGFISLVLSLFAALCACVCRSNDEE